MRTFFVILLLHLATYTQANNYYFSSITGDDARTAAQAQNPSTPWKTLAKLNSFFGSLKPGDSVLLKRNETFYGSIDIDNHSGTATLPIVIGAFGLGNKPVITGFKTLSNWVSVGNGIYESYNAALNTTLNTVLLNGNEQQIGRYPNRDEAIGGYLYFESHVGATAIIDNEFASPANYWTGAEIVVRQRRWILDRAKILSHSGTKIQHTPISGAPYDNYGYFIQNSIKTLDKFGEWYYSPSTKKLSVYFGSNSPDSYVVQATAITDLVNTNRCSNIVFDNINTKGANENCFNIYSGKGIFIRNCDIQFSGINGIKVWGNHPNFKIEGSIVSNSNNNAIDLGYGDHAIVRNNKVVNTSLFAGMGLGDDGNGFALNRVDNGTLIELNEIRNTGYIPISFSGDYVTIKNNYIDSFCSVKDDGGGIYTFGGIADINRRGRKIIGNIILNGVGAGNGTEDIKKKASQGIYLDGNASGVELINNTVSNVNRGFYLHNCRDIIVNNNTLYNNQVQLYLFQQSYLSPIRNNSLTNNIVFPKLNSQLALSLISNTDDLALFAKFDSNYYARPLDDGLLITNSFVRKKESISQTLDLEGWKKQYKKDGSSKTAPKEIVPYKLKTIVGPNKVSNSTISTIKGMILASCSVSLGVSGLLDGTYLEVTPDERSSSVYTRIGDLSADKNYLLKYSVKGSEDSNMTIGTFLRQLAYPYTILTPIQYRKVSKTRNDYEILFSSLPFDGPATLVFKVDNESKYYLDNIELYEANAAVTNPDDSIRFEYNPTNLTKSVALNGSYVDARSKSYSNSVILEPYTSVILIKSKPGPTVNITSPVNNTKFIPSANVTINAIAADTEGFVSKVEFYEGSTLLGTDDKSPYSFTWKNVSAGSYTITANAINSSSIITSSSPVNIVVETPNVAPTINITSPQNNTRITAPGSVIIKVSATDIDGTVSKVDFYNDNTLLGTDNVSPYSFTWNNITAGNYTVTAKATDNGSLVTISSPVTITVRNSNSAPTVSITTPLDNATFITKSNITINAIAADANGSITKVDFYQGATLLGTDNTSPYSFTWNNVAAGNYTITAKATDNNSLVTISSPVGISVKTPNTAPTVSITTPLDNATFNSNSSITINAIAEDVNGSVSKVDFYKGATLLGTDNASPYSFTWNNVAAGNYTITAKATDNNDASAISSAVLISVKTPNQPPLINITSPLNNETFDLPENIIINAVASDVDGSIDRVEFYKGNKLIGSDNTIPYRLQWKNPGLGNYTITAKAIDNNSLSTISSPVIVSIRNPKINPTVDITTPVNNESFTVPANITINATAGDADGSITKVEFYNENTLLGSDNTSPYTLNWNGVSAGTYTLTAKAIDNDLMTATSSPVTIEVTSIAPAVSIIKPLTNASFTALDNISMSAAASDADGTVTKVKFYNGNKLIGIDSIAPYTCTLRNVPAGTYTLTAQAIDNSSLVTVSFPVIVSITKLYVPPVVNITSPEENLTYSSAADIQITAEASDADGTISKVEFYEGATLLKTVSYAAYSWQWNNVPPGNHTIIAKAYDNDGLETTSAPVTFLVKNPNTAPLVSITSPEDNSPFISTQPIVINAGANDLDGLVTKVDFYNGNTLMGTDSTSPYTFIWNNAVAGNYSITATATDDGSLSTTSFPVSISVTTPNVAPEVNITSPLNNQIFTPGTDIDIAATATDADGNIKKVEFYRGNTLIKVERFAKYECSWNNAKAGNYVITAKAFDDSGFVSISSVNIRVQDPAPTLSRSANSSYQSQSPIKLDFKLSPNPASNIMQINFESLQSYQKANLSIMDLSGSLLKSIPLVLSNNKIKVDISSLTPGTYIMRISNDKFTINKKFMKVN